MIISCSLNALRRIQEARYRRAAKADGRPLIVEGKQELDKLRASIATRSQADELIWNLDLTEAPVTDGEKTIGRVVTGYLYQHEAQFTIVLNSLDDADLCCIGSVARNAIEAAFADCRICPNVTDDYLTSAEELAAEVVEASDLRFEYQPNGPSDETLVIPNANRSAASGLTKTRNQHEAFLFGEHGACVSHEPIDRYAGYRLNERNASYKGKNSAKRMGRPFVEMRTIASHFVGGKTIPCVDLKLTLVDDRYLYRKYETKPLDDVPECWRVVRVPIDAPLSWIHEVIQKTFSWYDYHLHRFSFKDFATREAFEELFDVEFGIERYDGPETAKERQSRYEAEDGHLRFKRLSGLDDKWLMRAFGPFAEAELIRDDFPQASLPENMPVGLALFGSERYEDVMGSEHLESDRLWRKRMRRYHEAIRKDAGREQRPDATAAEKTLDPRKAQALYYNYDFGDNWELSIEAVGVCLEPASTLPSVLDGFGHTPPEDCGGISGFARVIAAHDLVHGKPAGESAGSARSATKEVDSCDDAELAEAEGLMNWAYYTVGWRPFEGADSLKDVFDKPGLM